MEKLYNYLYVFFCAMLPIVELRGAIPLGAGLDLSPILIFIVSVLGNFLPVPFILLFIRKIITWMQGTKLFHKIADWLVAKADKNAEKVTKYATFGLFIFVAIPLPVTGAWTGALVAAMLNMKMKYALPSIFCGLLCAGIIVMLICYGFLGALSFLL